jgi:N-acetylmuramoyl-L-alanine amidase
VPIDTIVLHYTGMADAASAIGRLCDPRAAVSAHYVVEEDGNVWRLVEEEMRAFHAGVSYWRGHTALNGRSIGVEIVNPGHEFGYRGFPRVQMEAVLELCLGIQARHPIEARNVVAHSDVAPDRKQDPGELFDWRFLAEGGVGLWPEGVALDCRVARAARNDGVGMALAGCWGRLGMMSAWLRRCGLFNCTGARAKWMGWRMARRCSGLAR